MVDEPIYPGGGLRCVGKHISSARNGNSFTLAKIKQKKVPAHIGGKTVIFQGIFRLSPMWRLSPLSLGNSCWGRASQLLPGEPSVLQVHCFCGGKPESMR